MPNVDITDFIEGSGNQTLEPTQPVITGKIVTQQQNAIDAAKGNAFESIGKLVSGLAGLASGAQGAMEPASRDADKAQGFASVTRDKDNNIQVQPHSSFTFGFGGNEGSAALAAGTGAKLGIEMGQDIAEHRRNSGEDLGKFDKDTGAYMERMKGTLANVPGGSDAYIRAAQQIAQNRENMVTNNAARGLKNSSQSLTASIEQANVDLGEMARQGQAGSAEYMQKVGERNASYQKIQDNPLLSGNTPAEIQKHIKDDDFKHLGAAITGNVDSAYADGGALKATDRAQDAIQDLEGYGEADKDILRTGVTNRLAFLQGENKVAVDDLKTRIGAIQEYIHQGGKVSEKDLDQIDKQAGGLGWPEGHATIEGIRRAVRIIPPGFSPAQAGAAAGIKQGGQPLSPLETAPGRPVNMNGVNPQLAESVAAGASHLPPGYKVQIIEGFNAAGHVAGSHHHTGNAIDVQIVDPQGNIIPNQGADSTGMYQRLHNDVEGEANSRFGIKLGHGINFGTVSGGSTPDLMHFDTGGPRGRLNPDVHIAGTPGVAYGQPMPGSGYTAPGKMGQAAGSVYSVIDQAAGGDQHVAGVMKAIYEGESEHGGSYDIGDNGASFGPFQLNIAGGRLGAQFTAKTGLDPRDPATVPQQAKFVADYIRSHPDQDLSKVWFGLPHGQERIAKGQVHPNDTATGSGGGQPSANGIPYTAQEVADNPHLLSELIRVQAADTKGREEIGTRLGASLEKSIGNDVPLSPDDLAYYDQVTRGNPKFADQRDHILGVAAADQTLSGDQSQIAESRRKALEIATTSGDIHQRNIAGGYLKHLDGAAEALKKDPSGYALRRTWITPSQLPKPLDYGQPGQVNAGALAAGLAQRGQIAANINIRQPDFAPSALLPEDLAGANRIIAGGSPDQKIALLAAIGQLPDNQQKATIDALKTGDKASITFGHAAMVATWSPATAEDILTGMSVLSMPDAKQYKPDEKESGPAFRTALPTTDLAIPEARGRIYDAAEAVYAAKIFRSGAGDGSFKSEVWNDAVHAVTGGVLNYRGTKIIAPVPGMTQYQFSQRVRGVTDAEMHGATLGGHPVPAAALTDPWGPSFGTRNPIRLQTAATDSTDSGKYLVITGDPAAPQKVIDPTTGRGLIIDLSKPTGINVDMTAPPEPVLGASPNLMTFTPPSWDTQQHGGGTQVTTAAIDESDAQDILDEGAFAKAQKAARKAKQVAGP